MLPYRTGRATEWLMSMKYDVESYVMAFTVALDPYLFSSVELSFACTDDLLVRAACDLLLCMRIRYTDWKNQDAFNRESFFLSLICLVIFQIQAERVQYVFCLMHPQWTGPACIIFQLLRKMNGNVSVKIHWARKASGTEISPEMEAWTASFYYISIIWQSNMI